MEALTHAVGDAPSPANMPQVRRKQDPLKRRGRAFGLGERDPKKADVTPEDFAASARWRKFRKLVQAGRLTGSKY